MYDGSDAKRNCAITCTKCGVGIDAQTVALVKKVKARFYPGQDPPPPKFCTSCLLDMLQDLIDDDGSNATHTKGSAL